MDLSAIFSTISSWLSQGPIGIITGLLGLGAVGLLFYKIANYVRESIFQGGITSVSTSSGKTSQDLSSAMSNNSETILKYVGLEQIKLKQDKVPQIVCADHVKAGTGFWVLLRNIPAGSELFADKQWSLAIINSEGKIQVSLLKPGVRTLDVKLGNTWYSRSITVL